MNLATKSGWAICNQQNPSPQLLRQWRHLRNMKQATKYQGMEKKTCFCFLSSFCLAKKKSQLLTQLLPRCEVYSSRPGLFAPIFQVVAEAGPGWGFQWGNFQGADSKMLGCFLFGGDAKYEEQLPAVLHPGSFFQRVCWNPWKMMVGLEASGSGFRNWVF